MSHDHPPGHPPHTAEEMTKDIDAVERGEKAAADKDKFLKPSPDGLGPTLGSDLKTPKR
jgi:hypothetical protein